MDPTISDLPPGAVFSVVARVLAYEDDRALCAGMSPHQIFKITGAPQDLYGDVTFYDLTLDQEDPGSCLYGEGSAVFPHPPKDAFSQVTMMDFCSGMGGFTIGSQLLGMRTLAFVDKNEMACAALRANFHCPVIQGDLGTTQVLTQAHALKENHHLEITGGFPCQGFSLQGDRMGMQDQRSHALHHLLRGSWLLQADSILLECVANVLQFPEVQECIQRHAQLSGMHVQTLVFDLQDQWPARRNRFWCYMTYEHLPNAPLQAWPTSPSFSRLDQIMPMDAIWDDQDELDLQWDQTELAMYSDPRYGSEVRILEASGKAPTALHSWGHVARDCPCGCRTAFHPQRLLQGGARGFGMVSAKTGLPRHTHSQEGAMLCTVLPSYKFPMTARAALTLLGKSPHPSRQLCLQLEDTESTHYISIQQPLRVQDLINAEKQMVGWGYYVTISSGGFRLQPQDFLRPDVLYTIHHHKRKQVKPFPAEIFAGGPGAECFQLGDKVIWSVMQEITKLSCTCTESAAPFLMYPFSALHFLQQHQPDGIAINWRQRRHASPGDAHLICELHGHWLYLHGQWIQDQHGFQWNLYDGLRTQQAVPWIQQVLRKFSALLGVHHLGLTLGHGLIQRDQVTCGTMALLHMAQCAGLGTMADQLDIQALHGFLLLMQQQPGFLRAGGKDSPQDQLASLLNDKGVPLLKADERAQQVMQKLGIQKIQQVLKSRNPWGDLKAAASQPGKLIRLLQPDEQKAYINERARTKHGAQVANFKQKKQYKNHHPDQPLHLAPDHFILTAEHWKDDNDLPVPQLHFDDVESEARGVALCTTITARKFLEEPCTISTDALALLLIDQPAQEHFDQVDLQRVIIPARYKGTDEHTLIHGFILQIGDIEVSREHANQNSAPEVADTQVIKFQIYKDQAPFNWQDFVAAPIRALVKTLEILQLCRGKNCGAQCCKFHPGVDETLDSVIFEIWARSFFDDAGRKAQPEQATVFTVFMRIPSGALSKLLTTVPMGIYVEPRGDKPREHDPRYCVVWLPGSSMEEASHSCRTYEKAICLARMKSKYGIRVKKDDEKSAWAHLRPGTTFVGINVQLIFELFPIPHGTQRHAIEKLLRDWKWLARPLQPSRGNFDHMAWRVGAQEAPPQPVMTGFQNDIIITQIKELKPKENPQQLVASHRTQRRLREGQAASSSGRASDPWQDQGKDPWARPGGKPAASSQGDGKQRLAEIQEQLKQEIHNEMDTQLESKAQAALQAAAASTGSISGAQEKRMQALEVGLSELKGQNQQFTGWFREAGDRLKATEHTLGVMQQTINTHQTEIHALGNTFQNTMKNVKTELSSELNDNFDKQFSRLEALLEKRHKTQA
eukprot:Skav229522  [mRNA]  locus=scaffold887:104903:109116:+ [translate_table: standard]